MASRRPLGDEAAITDELGDATRRWSGVRTVRAPDLEQLAAVDYGELVTECLSLGEVMGDEDARSVVREGGFDGEQAQGFV